MEWWTLLQYQYAVDFGAHWVSACHQKKCVMAIMTVRMVLMRVQPTAVNANRINVVRKFNTTDFLPQ